MDTVLPINGLSTSPCLSCGACCAKFRVSFYWGETNQVAISGTPHELTSPLPPHRVYMNGTESHLAPRCVALNGEIGINVACEIYENRPSPCRDFKASFENGEKNTRCDEARLSKGLPPLTPEDWQPPHLPEIIA